MTTLLEVRRLSAAYGNITVLHGVSFGLEHGAITTILGANGAGKSTILRALSGLVATQGDVQLAGKSIVGMRAEDIARLGVAHVPDDRGTFAQVTTEENLRLGAYTRKDRREVERDFDRIYAYFPKLKERRKQQAGTLSGGEQQMLAISRALMLRPKLLLLDEPSFGLAPLIVEDIYRILREINQRDGVSMLLVEQNATLALELADHAHLLETGRIVLSQRSSVMKNEESIRRSYLGY